MADEYATRASLLLRLKEDGGDADWEQFYRQYARFILSVASRAGLSSSHAQDVLQETMVELIRVLKKFDYNRDRGTFRGFLRTVVSRKVIRFRKRLPDDVSLDRQEEGHAAMVDLMEDEDSPSPLKAMEVEWREAVLAEAFERLRDQHGARPEHLEVLAGLLAGETIKELEAATGIKANAIYQVKHRLVDKLKDEVRFLMEEMELNPSEESEP